MNSLTNSNLKPAEHQANTMSQPIEHASPKASATTLTMQQSALKKQNAPEHVQQLHADLSEPATLIE